MNLLRSTAVRRTSQDSKYQITEQLFNIILTIILITILANLVDFAVKPANFEEKIFILQVDLINLSVTGLLAHIHRKGHSRFAGISLLIFLVLIISANFDLATLSQMMIIYALPILMASFLIGPASSFVFALVCTLGYSLTWAANATASEIDFSMINVSTFYGLAALSWMVSRQINTIMVKLQADEHRLKSMVTLYQMQDSTTQQIAERSLAEGVWITQSDFGFIALASEDETNRQVFTWTRKADGTAYSGAVVQKYSCTDDAFWQDLFQTRRAVVMNKSPRNADAIERVPGRPDPVRRHLVVPVLARDRVVAVIGMINKRTHYDESDANQLALLGGQVWSLIERRRMVEELERYNQDLTEAYENTLYGWVRTLEERNRETQEHSQRVADLSVRLAKALGLSEEETNHLRRGALLHDIGKMGIPDEILLKKGPLNDQDWEIMRRHPEIAYKILSPIRFLQPALDVPYCHHERWDGTGYPRGLRELEIPLHARIFSVVDVWEALTHDRVYHPAWPVERAASYLEEQSGRQFDPLVVEVFLGEVIPAPRRMLEPAD